MSKTGLQHIGKQVWRVCRTLPKDILLRYDRAASIGVLVIGLVLCLAAASFLLLREPPLTQTDQLPVRQLDTASIDVLEYWIEEVQAERQRGLQPPAGAFGVGATSPTP